MQRIDIFDIKLNRTGTLFTWISLLWEHQYNSLGSFQLEVQQTADTTKLLKPWIYLKLENDDKPMIATSLQVKDKKIILRGHPAIYILQKRVSDIVFSSTNAEQAMHHLVGSMKPWENLRLGKVNNLLDKYANQVSDKSILEYCEIIGKETDVGFYIKKQKQALFFECFKPEQNLNIKLSENYGNLANIVYNVSESDHYNVAVVAGMAIDNAAITEYYSNVKASVDIPTMTANFTSADNIATLSDGSLILTYPASHESRVDFYIYDGEVYANVYDRYTEIVGEIESKGYLRREMYLDARDLQQDTEKGETIEQYAERLKLRGLSALADKLKIQNIDFEIDDDRAKLGDLISVTIPAFDLRLVARIVSDKIKSQNNYMVRTVKVGTPINYSRGLRI